MVIDFEKARQAFFEPENDCALYLEIAAKIVETVAFEIAPTQSPEKVERLLEIATQLEQVAVTPAGRH